jgi:type IV secretory pathway TrbD component
MGCIAAFLATVDACLGQVHMRDKPHKEHRTIRVFKSLHKPLTYLGVERTLFYFVCVGAVGAFNLFNSILAGIAVFIGGFAFGHWVTNSDPAFLRILAKSERYKLRYDAAKLQVPRVEVV